MGIIKEYNCSSCGSKWEVRIGCGMMHGILENVLPAFSEEVQKKIIEATQSEEFPRFEFNYHAAACSKCLNVAAVPVIKLMRTDERYIGSCPYCNSAAEVMEQVICPRCGSRDVKSINIGHWD